MKRIAQPGPDAQSEWSEEALRESEAYVRLAMQAGRLAAVTFYLHPPRVSHSRAFAQLLGFEPDQRLSMADVHGRYHPEDRERVLTDGRAAVNSSADSYEVEHRVIWPDGSVRWIYGRGEVAHDASGRAISVTAVYLDTTEQKAVEAALRESEDHYRHAVLLNPHVAWTAGPDGVFERMANRWVEWTGLTGLGEEAATAVHPDDLKASNRAWRHALKTGEPYDAEQRIRMVDGSYRWMRARAFPRRDETGAVIKWYGATEDIHERRTAEAALRESEANFRAFAQAVPNHIWTAPGDGRHDWLNDGVYDYTGLSPEEFAQVGWAGVIHPDDLPTVAAVWSHALSSGTTYRCEIRLRRFDGAWRWHLVQAVPLRNEAGEVYRWVGANTDIDDQKAASEELARLNATLESRVEERSRELRIAEEALRQSHKMEAVGQLTGGIAHDFNNLLTGIIGSLDVLRRRIAAGRTDDLERFMDAAVASAERAAGLTHRLLAFSRRQSLDPRPIAINDLVESLGELLRRTLGENIGLEFDLDAELWTAETDANQLESALLNLAINARDAMPDGGTLRIATRNGRLTAAQASRRDGLEPGDYVRLSVSDTGVGMTQHVIDRAFEPFFTTKPIGQGTGLGLSMIYGFARQSGGHVRIESEPGRGATVELLLPRRHAAPADQAPAAAPGARRPAAGEQVLLVEDDPAVRMLVVEVLRDLGYGYLEAEDGPAALPILQSDRRIDLLISDVGLPGMNGRQLAEAARQARPGLKVLFITGYAEHAVVRGGFLAPGMDIVAKPFALDALAGKIRQMLQS